MTPRERELAAIRHEVPDRVPADVICIETVDEVAAFMGIDAGELYDSLGIDGRIVAAGYTDQLQPGDGGPALNEWHCEIRTDYSQTTAHRPLAGATTVHEVDSLRWPDPSLYDYEGAAYAARTLGQRYAVRGPYWYPVFCRVCDMLGLEQALVTMCWDPSLFDAVLGRVAEIVLEYSRRLLGACGDDMPIFCLGDDFATQRGLMMSPEHWRKHIRPALSRIFDMAKRSGRYVWFHSCGDITPVLPDLVDMGMDVWETVQLHALPVRACELKRDYGRHITFFGGINTQHLPFASPDEVREETALRIRELAEGGGYICGPDHHIKPDVPPGNVVALFRACSDFRGAGYTLRL